MERNQIINAIYLVQREVGVNTMGIRDTGNKPPTADPALEFVAVKCIGPVHNKLKIIEFVPFSMQNCLGCLFRVHFIKTCVNFLLFRALEIQLPPFFGIGRFRLVLGWCSFPFAKGKGSKADINITVLAEKFAVGFSNLLRERGYLWQ